MLLGLWYVLSARAELQTARELGEQLLSLAQRAQDPALLLEAHHALGQTLFFLGEFAPARAHLEQGIALYDPQQHRSHAFLYRPGPRGGLPASVRPGPCGSWLSGPGPAGRVHEALTLAQELAHPFSLAFALNFAAMLHQFRREARRPRAGRGLHALATEQGFAFLA